MSTKIMLIDDHDVVREAICGRLEKEPGCTVIGEGRNGHDAVKLARQLDPDIAVMDIYMPHLNGIEATKQIVDHNRKCKVIGLSSCHNQRAINRMMAAGAMAYVYKGWPFQELCRAIHAVHGKQQYCHSMTLPLLHPSDEPVIPNAGQLSKRERTTLALIAAGKSSRDIAATLCVCIKTVEAHRHNLRRKLGCSSVAELTRYAIEGGMVQVKIPRRN